MTLNLIDHARVLIQEALAKPNGFVDANAIAAKIHKLYPIVDLRILIDAVVEETIVVRGSVAWHKTGMNDPGVFPTHLIQLGTQRTTLSE